MPKALVTGVDIYRWVVDGEIQEAVRGDEIDVSDEEFHRVEGALSKPGNSGASSGGWPSTHDGLDELAEGVESITVTPGEGKKKSTWNDGAVKSTDEKVAALQAAGVSEPTTSDSE